MAVSARVVSQHAIDFRRLCCELQKTCPIASYDRIVNELLDSRHGHLMDRASHEDIAYVFGIPRIRAQQLENNAMKHIRALTNQATKTLRHYVGKELK